MFLADHQIDAGDGQHDGKQKYSRRGCIGRITTAVTVEHIVNITYYRIHLRCIQIRSEQPRHCMP